MKCELKLDFTPEGLYGGALVGVRTADFIQFFDWEGRLVRRIEVPVRGVHWAESGELVALLGDTSTFILRYNRCARCLGRQMTHVGCCTFSVPHGQTWGSSVDRWSFEHLTHAGLGTHSDLHEGACNALCSCHEANVRQAVASNPKQAPCVSTLPSLLDVMQL